MTKILAFAFLVAGLALAACAPGPGPRLSPQEQADFSDAMTKPDPLSNSEIPPANAGDPN